MVGKSLPLVGVTQSHHGADPTIDGGMATWSTVTDFAAALGVARRRIAKWREDGAPVTLDPGLWRSWLLRVGKRRYAAVIDQLRPDLATGLAAGSQVAEAPAAQPIPGLPSDATSADRERHWKEHRARLQVELLEMEKAERDRRLVKLDQVKLAFHALVAGVLQAQADHVWLALLPELDGIDPGLRRRLRARHDAAIASLRERMQIIVKQSLAAVITQEAKP